MKQQELKDFMDAKVLQYNNSKFIATDPIQVPHKFEKKEDIEISAFLTATISWGNRKSIIKNANRMMQFLDNDPFQFVMHHKESDLDALLPFVHRTFNGTDFTQFIKGLKNLYTKHHGLESVFRSYAHPASLQPAISAFKQLFFEIPHPSRTTKHISDPLKGSAAKRINMFLRWMVRKDTTGVDFGLWDSVSPSQLSCPLDVHSGRVARSLGLLHRKQNDAKALIELDKHLRQLDPTDPVKYDYALFGLGVFEKW
ncbi:TIGR02757 family protein [Muriicola sp. Z0-33]|uniref:TIGR02757 family protein n=1 Tax=Muriicola sp. Z0-33 TaxID=2816957 RepID=UPI0022373F2A|nr:TIGR02757 family protein [Muriicola sp. Z0-33]MCW5516663.1 TIGR02757 family protein [Muriicola sp. Z0-33]